MRLYSAAESVHYVYQLNTWLLTWLSLASVRWANSRRNEKKVYLIIYTCMCKRCYVALCYMCVWGTCVVHVFCIRDMYVSPVWHNQSLPPMPSLISAGYSTYSPHNSHLMDCCVPMHSIILVAFSVFSTLLRFMPLGNACFTSHPMKYNVFPMWPFRKPCCNPHCLFMCDLHWAVCRSLLLKWRMPGRVT